MHRCLARNTLSVALGAAIFGAAAPVAIAQDAASPAPSGQEPQAVQATDLDQVTVRGFRRSLQYSTEAKRDATGFVDAIFSEDIGKFPDVNIAESLARVPGIQISRELNGEGQRIAIRGLGDSFTKTTINGNSVATASISYDNANQNRETDLSLFPSEFFNKVTVYKSPKASLPEGGAAGLVDMTNAHAFDNPGTHLTYSLQGAHNSTAGKTSPQGTLIGSWTNDEGTFGVLAGVTSIRNKMGVKGWEDGGSDNWTTPALTAAQCGGICGPDVGTNRWGIWPSVPTAAQNAGASAAMVAAGLTPGETIDSAWLLAHNPGLTMQQINNALIPALGRPANISGTRDRDSFLGSVEWRPTDDIHVWVDGLYTQAQRNTKRMDMDLLGRNFSSPTGMVPLDMQVDGNNVVTDATFAGAQAFLQYRPYTESVDYWQINPGATFWFGDDGNIKLDVVGGISRSWMRRVMPTVMVNSPYFVADYTNHNGFPTYTSGDVDLNDPNAGWTFNDIRLQNEKRLTKTSNLRADLQLGDDSNNVRVGVSTDTNFRRIQAFDNGAAWRTNVYANISNAELSQFLVRGPGFIGVDWGSFMAATDFANFASTAPEVNTGAINQQTGSIDETNKAAYVEVNTASDVWGRELRVNAGVRYATTDHTLSGPVTLNGVRQWQTIEGSYGEWLPSFSAAWDVAEDVVLRMSASKTMTRPAPGSMLPGTTLGGSGIDTATQGNPELAPYISTNFDIGGEWYTGDEGFVGVTFFNKRVQGYTFQGSTRKTLAELGIPYASLNAQQQSVVDNAIGGYDAFTVAVTQQVNADAALNVRGWETIWVQPLDFVFNGLGFMANYTKLNVTTIGRDSTALAGNIFGVSPKMWNATAYWEGKVAQVRLSYNWAEGAPINVGRSSLPWVESFFEDRGQLDLSASYTLANLPTSPQITLSATNLQNKPLVAYFGENMGRTYYEPGRTITLGIRGTF
ncbi:TonB-dependent receptor [Pseudoxanthomonas sp. J35]|uniref:TonB-dependent receptor n=1 Tax=Pseudoxanthomonas sp. J35 TaxID=935852 RepID=UPI00048BA974|nr:TonB-dependent receptor [Pseudoxanthomonas sp. J35]